METQKKSNKLLSELLALFKAPVITEKSVKLAENQQYTFLVDQRLNKYEIKKVIEKLFNVKIKKVKTLIVPIKLKRIQKFRGKISQYKKAYVQLESGHTISNLFE